MKVICIKQPHTMIDTEFIVGKEYTCFKKIAHITWLDIAHITWLDKDGAYRGKEEILDGWYVSDEKNNIVEAISSSFISLSEYRENKISDILK